MHPTADTWQTLIIAVTYTVEMGGGEKRKNVYFKFRYQTKVTNSNK